MEPTVLLADDSITVQKIVKLSLAEEGIEVITVSNGEQAIQKLHEVRPSLVLADVFMPGKDGYEVCDYIKSHSEFSNLPVILLVHAYEPFDADRAKQVKADSHLTKPFQSINTLVDAVQALLAGEQVSTLSVSQTEPQTAAIAQSALAIVGAASGIVNEYQELGMITPIATISNFETVELVSSEQEITGPGALIPTNFDSSSTFDLASTFTPPPAEEPLTAQPQEENNSPKYSEENLMLPLLEETAEPGTLPSFTTDQQYSPATLGGLNASFGTSDEVLDLDDVLNPAPMVTLPETDLFADADNLPVLAHLTHSVEPVSETQPAPDFTPMPLLNVDLDTGQNLSSVAEPALELSPIEPLTQPLEWPLGSPMVAAQVEQPQKQDTGHGQSNTFEPNQFSEAMIEQIVNRVVERLSSKAIEEVAWEVVPELAEALIRKQMAQQK